MNVFFLIFCSRDHPENPARISRIYDKLNVVDEFGNNLASRCRRLDARDATQEELSWIHTSEYLNQMNASTQMKQSELNLKEKKFKSVFICPQTQSAALLSAGSCLQVVHSILSGESQSGFAVSSNFHLKKNLS